MQPTITFNAEELEVMYKHLHEAWEINVDLYQREEDPDGRWKRDNEVLAILVEKLSSMRVDR